MKYSILLTCSLPRSFFSVLCPCNASHSLKDTYRHSKLENMSRIATKVSVGAEALFMIKKQTKTFYITQEILTWPTNGKQNNFLLLSFII